MGLIVDLFAGGGGASLGVEMALGRAVDVAINHSPEAVAIHAANHPTTRHFVQNIHSVLPREAVKGRPVDVLWASPDCKHFSKAKGTAPKERNIRELGWAVVRWVRDVRPKLVCVENVEEFLTWGPLDAEGQPIKARAGETFRRWAEAIRAEGYSLDWRTLRACDYGAPTIRRRLFVIARRDRKPIKWPEPTHGPGRGRPYRTAAECIDWSIPVPSIFDRKKPLAENTLRRIAEGLRRYVIETDKPFIVQPDQAGWILQANGGNIGRDPYWPMSTICQTGSQQQLANATLTPFIQHVQHGGRGRCGVMPADEPLRTITAYPKGGCMALVSAFLAKANHTADYYHCFRGQGLALPVQTITQSPGFSLVSATLIQTGYGERTGQRPRVPGLGKPLGTVVAGGMKHALVAAHLSHFYGTLQDGDIEGPMKTVTSGGLHSGLVSVFLSHFYSQSVGSGLWSPTPTATIENKIGYVSAFLTKYYGTALAEPLHLPMSTLTSHDKLGLTTAFLTKYYGNGTCHSPAEPFGTLTTRERYGLVTVHQMPLVWVEGEPYVIADIGLRMLTPRELARAQGFPDGYIFDPILNGKRLTQKSQVASIGNSVPPDFSDVLIGANKDALEHEVKFRKPPEVPLFTRASVE